MDGLREVLFYAFSFVSLYVQIFFLYVFLEKRKDLLVRTEKIELPVYPGVTITVPAYNESHNVEKTIKSLLELDYPKDKLFINIVDDGSTDDTWQVMQQYKDHPQIKLFHKENGGKYTANNLGLENSYTEFVGCLDSDSMVHPESLKRIMTYFFSTDVMAVAPTIVTHDPKTLVQRAQSIEYDFSIFVKKMLSFVDAIHVTPGPFSIFRKAVFDQIGPYRHAHNTEDQEIALRMKEHHMRIEHAPDAFVYTIGPRDIRGLYRQRLRWIYGFIKNVFDYRHLVFRRQYGNIGFITLPSGIVSVLSVIFLFFFTIYNLVSFFYRKILTLSATGNVIGSPDLTLSWFYVPTSAILFITILVYLAVFNSLFIGQKIKQGKIKLSINIILFFFIYSIVAPFWLMKAIYNALKGYQASWTEERDARGI
jgi:cellulose synthase/poly-beta-1,6-N-acetylglucosamine synthase-like glycosyltransferase